MMLLSTLLGSEKVQDEYREILRVVLERTELFLGADLPYEQACLTHGKHLRGGCSTVVLVIATGSTVAAVGLHWISQVLLVVTTIVALATVVLATLDHIVTRNAARKPNPKKIRSIAQGELRCWPFETESDLQTMLERRAPLETAERETLDQ